MGLVTRSSCVDRQRRERPSSVIRAAASGLDRRSESSRGIGRRNGEAARGARVRIVAAAAEDADKEGASAKVTKGTWANVARSIINLVLDLAGFDLA